MLRMFAFTMIAGLSLIAFGGIEAGPVSVSVTEPAAASCIAHPDGGCLGVPLPVDCRPFEGKKYLGNLDICLR